MNVQKKIFTKSRWLLLLRSAALLFLIFHCAALPVYAGRVLHYKTYHPQTGENFNRFHYSMENIESGGYRVHWVIEEGGMTIEEDYILNTHFETLKFRVVNDTEGTDYTGQRKNDTIILSGQFKGKEVDHVMPIDDRPFYYNPKLGLTAFVQSGEKSGRFWGFQNKELNVYPMKASNQGLDEISVNGKDMKAVKVYWTVDDFRSAFFKRTYWFRESDGLYLKQKAGGGKFRELVSEEGE